MKGYATEFCNTGHMMKSVIYGTFAILALSAFVCVAAPEPAIVPAPRDWTMEVTFEHPQQIMVQMEKGGPTRFWYTIVTLTNQSDQDVDFYPTCDLMTDTFHIIPANKHTPEGVFEQIKMRHKRKYPFLEPLEKTGNKMLEGEDNARDIAIIWPDFDKQVKNMKVFIGGLSNETAVVGHPVSRDEAGEPVMVYLRKTLEISYSMSGDPVLRSYTKVSYKGKRWVMR